MQLILTTFEQVSRGRVIWLTLSTVASFHESSRKDLVVPVTRDTAHQHEVSVGVQEGLDQRFGLKTAAEIKSRIAARLDAIRSGDVGSPANIASCAGRLMK